MTDDMKQRIIESARRAIKRSHEDNDCVDRTEVDTVVLAGLLKLLEEQQNVIDELNGFINGFSKDAVVPVRCKDCKHGNPGECGYGIDCEYSNHWQEDDWFCADGERRTDDLSKLTK